MARRLYKRLTAAEIKKLANAPGMHADGDGLYLQVNKTGAASWVLRYLASVEPKRERYFGLGALRRVSLAEARQLAEAARRQRLDGVDPIDDRRTKQLARRAATVKALTFRQCAEAYIRAHAAGWKNPVHARQWPSTLEAYAYPIFGMLPVTVVDVGLVMQAVEPIWASKTETASRLRGRIESVLDWATVRGHRPAGDNPARWRGHLDHLLPKPSKAKAGARKATGRAEHHAALPYPEIADFVTALRRQAGAAARALEFAILTAGRTAEVIGARWSEIYLAERLWVIPAERMKAERDHRVPLAPAALAILDGMASTRGPDDAGGEYVFPGMIAGRPLSNMALLAVLRRMGRDGCTVHGFRSTFRDWAAEQTDFPAEVVELALAHAIGDKVEAAYRRGELLEKRRALATAWAAYCARLPDAPARSVEGRPPLAAIDGGRA
jgi:integrase